MHSFIKTALLASALLVSACNAEEPAPLDHGSMSAEITQMLHVQDAAWNTGDIDGFMNYYLKSETLRFASAGNVNRGWQATIDGYKKRYPDLDAMGKLSFTDMEIKVLSKDYAQVFGRWKLTRKDDEPGGLFTLLVQKIDGKWLIITDHTSSN